MIKYILIIISIFISDGLLAQNIGAKQDDFGGLEAGLNVGAYFGNSNTANFYNGTGTKAEEMNSADDIIYNIHYMDRINEVLEQNLFPYRLISGEFYTEYPTNMSYTPSINAGLTGRYWFNRSIGVSVSMNFARLNARDNFLIHTPNEIPTNKEPLYVLGTIVGQEDRVNIDIGLVNSFYLSDRMNLLVEYGFNFNNNTVKFNDIEIYGLVLDIRYRGPADYIPNSNKQQYNFKQGGLGYGGYINPGIQFNFTESMSIDLVSQFYYSYIDLEQYSTWGFHWTPFLRFNVSRLFF